jgi:ABC-type sugar transport system ATPase subunit
VISIEHVTKRFPGVTALCDVDMQIAEGELHAVVGENGAGKSTLMKILSGVITDFDGRLVLRGQAVRFRGTRDAEEAGISIIHQELNLVEQLSAAANIFLGREKHNALGLLDDRTMERAARGLLAQLECQIDARQVVRELRVGDQQLVEIAKALSLESGILIMDEPTSALTESEVARLYRVIGRLRERGVTILYISHKLDEVFRLAERITVLRDGKKVKTLERSQTNPREVTHLMVGREIEAVNLGDDRRAGAVVLEVQNLSLPWTGHARGWRLRNVNFQLHGGEILGIAGLMGAGRTELLECLFGSSPETPTGRILLEGREVNFTHAAEAKRAGIGLVTEDRKRLGLFAQMTVEENITMCALRDAAPGGEHGSQARGKDSRRRCPCDQPQWRQPAESNHRPLVVNKTQSVVAGRSNARRRCRRQGGTLPAHAPTLPGRPRHHPYLQRIAGVADALRSHPGAVRRPSNGGAYTP